MKAVETAGKRRAFLVLRIIVTCISAVGVIFFCIPILKDYFITESALMVMFCAFPALWLNLFPYITKKRSRRKITLLMYMLMALFAVLLIWLIFLSYKILTVKYEKPPENTTVVVLGAKVYEDSVSQSLQNRLDAALEYLNANPGAKCVVTGGQGNNEPRTEASASKEYLVSKGIDPERISEEDRSTSTMENLSNTKELLGKEEKLIVIATQGYHQYRARCMARDLGYTPYSIKAYSNPYLYPSYMARELLALTKYCMDRTI